MQAINSRKVCNILAFIVFLGANFLKFDFIMPMNASRIAMIVLSILSIYQLFQHRKQLLTKFKRLKSGVVKYSIFFIFLWCVYSMASIIWIHDLAAYLQTNFFLVGGTLSVAYFFMNIKSVSAFHELLKAILLAIAFNMVVAYVQKYGLSMDFNGFYGNINDQATVLMIGIAISIVLLKEHGKSRICYIAFIALSFFQIHAISSRGVELGLFLGLIVFANDIYRLAKKYITFNRNTYILLFVVLALIAIAGCYLFVKKIGGIGAPVAHPDNSNQVRVNLIYNGFHFLSQSHYLGVGAGNIMYFMEHFPLYTTQYGQWLILPIHNLWLEILVSYGVIIFAGFVVMYGSMLKSLLWIKHTDQLYYAAKGFAFFLVGFTIACISSSSNLNKEWFIILFGLILWVIYYRYQRKEIAHERNH